MIRQVTVGAASVRRLGASALRVGAVRRPLLTLGAQRRRALVLVYHRVGHPSADAAGVVPTVSPGRFREHLQVLADLATVVPLCELARPVRGGRLRVAVTFDDDYASHAGVTLAALRAAGVHATFFLCGRVLPGAGAFWWERLEAWIAGQGRGVVAAALGLPGLEPAELAARVEVDSLLRARVEAAAPAGSAPLDEAGIRALVAAGMGIGFHTRDHPLLPALPDEEVASAVHAGRAALGDLAGNGLRHFAYPHGKADARVAAAVRDAGYAAAWTGWPAPVRPGDDPFLLGRWEPGDIAGDRFAAALATRLWRVAPELAAARGS